MKNIYPKIVLILLTAMIIVFGACEEVIEIELDESDQRIVIEAVVNADLSTAIVIITKTGSFYQEKDFDRISGSLVTIQLPDGSTVTLGEDSAGHYSASGIAVQPTEKLSLYIRTPDGNDYRAEAETPYPVPLDTLEIEDTTGKEGRTAPGKVRVVWKDPADQTNFYRIRTTRNDTLQADSYSLADDKLRNGLRFSQRLFGILSQDGDVFEVELLSVTRSYYDYFRQLTRGGPGFGFTIPYNASGNLSNNALGYFGIISSSKRTITVQ
jgi:hypothetical protein